MRCQCHDNRFTNHLLLVFTSPLPSTRTSNQHTDAPEPKPRLGLNVGIAGLYVIPSGQTAEQAEAIVLDITHPYATKFEMTTTRNVRDAVTIFEAIGDFWTATVVCGVLF